MVRSKNGCLEKPIVMKWVDGYGWRLASSLFHETRQPTAHFANSIMSADPVGKSGGGMLSINIMNKGSYAHREDREETMPT